jgi:hypothetical protein
MISFVHGSVIDANGEGIVGAKVEVVGRSAYSVTQPPGGSFIIIVVAGTWSFKVSKPGFVTQIFNNVECGRESNVVLSPTGYIEMQYSYSLLLNMDSNYIDATGNHTAYPTENGVSFDTSIKKFGAASVYFEPFTSLALPYENSRVSPCVTVPYSSDFNFGTGPFTIDFWIRLDSVATTFRPFYIGGGPSGSNMSMTMSHSYPTGSVVTIDFIYNDGKAPHEDYYNFHHVAGPWNSYADWEMLPGQWHHIAIIRGWNDIPGYLAVTLNGKLLPPGYTHNSNGFPQTPENLDELDGDLKIGYNYITDHVIPPEYYYYNNPLRIDSFRITKGAALWTTDFTPPTDPSAI